MSIAMNLELFKEQDLYRACRDFFTDQCRVPLKTILEAPVALNQLGLHGAPEAKPIRAAYAIGLVDDAAFEGVQQDPKALQTLRDGAGDYPGIVVIALELEAQPSYSRGSLAQLTRRLNRHFKNTPVAVIFRYGGNMAFASIERVKYQQQWRDGEKVGKVSMLKDISISQPHRGHLSILSKLRISNTGTQAVRSFTQLYFYWRTVFSIAVLNKEFYDHIITWFDTAVTDIKIPGEKAGSERHKDFAVRLIARLIFIWFLKELRVVKDELLLPAFENGDDNPLIKPKRKGTSYYKFVLQNLFFNALNSDHKERNKDLFDVYAGSFEEAKKIKDHVFFSPYLNGGLFDVHPNDWCDGAKLNNGFSVPDDLFLDKDAGLNAILARYKFTIAENTPLEEEIAVDPEMLGRIFENLLAEQSEDTKEAARKSKGAFYTPRPVVSYMCRNVLHKHLGMEITSANGKAIVQRLMNTTVLDPACGSGAYPMGMLEEMMHVLRTVDPEGNLWVAEMMKSPDEAFKKHIADFIADKQIGYVKKLGLLKNCLFGIDILEYAVEITKLRCWLSLIVEQRVDFKKPNYNLKPLPNLEFKFYQKNSLLRMYDGENLNQLAEHIDSDKLLQELVQLENQFFIARSNVHGTKEQIKANIIGLLEKVVDSQSAKTSKGHKLALDKVNQLRSAKASEREQKAAANKAKKLAERLGELAKFRTEIKDYFIERVTFPGICNPKAANPGFDIVIGNPPYVNTKQISKQGLTDKLKEEYGYCDDLYNHFTVRGLELVKRGGYLSYITSDTFLTLQSKENLRRLFLGLPATLGAAPEGIGQVSLMDQLAEDGECHLLEVINTPKAFAALVDTAIFTVQREPLPKDALVTYIDLRYPNAETFGISEEEWQLTKAGKDNTSGWERVLDRTFTELGVGNQEAWKQSHTCDGTPVLRDEASRLQKYRVTPVVYQQAIGHAVFAPNPYNCQLLEKVVKPARVVFDQWWPQIETSRSLSANEVALVKYRKGLAAGSWTLMGMVTSGGVGLQTGDNGVFVGYRSGTTYATTCAHARPGKLLQAIEKYPVVRRQFPELRDVYELEDAHALLGRMKEPAIWELFDGIKEKHGPRAFGKGFMYRIIPESMVFDVDTITDKQKTEGIKGKRCYVPYDKGDRAGNRWYAETPYVIDWSAEAVGFLSTDETARWQGYQFFFRNGFCWSDVLNPNSQYIKCRLKNTTVNDVKSMSLYDESGLGDEVLVLLINSYLSFKLLREFLNNTVAIQINDIRKLPVKVPSKEELAEFKKLFGQCLKVKQAYFKGDLDAAEMKEALEPLEREVDVQVGEFYGITAEAPKDLAGEEADELEPIDEEDED